MTAGAPRFLVDHMLVKLGKYLRIVGLDATWHPGARSLDLVERANLEARVFLTRNARLAHQEPRADRELRVESDDPVAQLRQVLDRYDVDPRARLFTRCIRCNLPLDELDDLAGLGEPAERIPPRVRERHDRFFRCPGCGTIFWRGTHVENTCRKLGLDAGGSRTGAAE